ncbi:MAG: hypothetical protein JXN60_05865 [Lentisphaerae bacterium]|nr:hypothetical protein [Lentisphaerota bacterium]
MATGGAGGFLASVLDCGTTGQQQQASIVSAEDIDLGGGGGSFLSVGGGMNPGSSEPSPLARTVPLHNVAASIDAIAIYFLLPLFILSYLL